MLTLRSALDFVRGRPPLSAHLDLLESQDVKNGWLLVDAYERLGTDAAAAVFQHELEAWFEYARATVNDLKPGDSTKSLTVSEGDNNRLRHRRTLDFVLPGERVFDVGVGRGYLGGLLIRDRDIAAYHGIDIVPRYIDTTHELLSANDLDLSRVDIELGDLFKLTREKVAKSRASLVICCEVLEHVPNPEGALITLAMALPEGTDLLFSVPLNGRLESVWGHVTVFDVARLKSMTRAAGLHVHHVEPVANQWTFVVASRDATTPARVRMASTRTRTYASVPLQAHHDFIDVSRDALSVASGGSEHCALEPSDYGRTICRVTSTSANESRGGVAFPVKGLTSLRFELGLIEFDHVTTVVVNAYAGHVRAGGWTWKPTVQPLRAGQFRRFAVRPGLSDPYFRADRFDAANNIDQIEILVEVPAGVSAAFSVRAAYLP